MLIAVATTLVASSSPPNPTYTVWYRRQKIVDEYKAMVGKQKEAGELSSAKNRQ